MYTGKIFPSQHFLKKHRIYIWSAFTYFVYFQMLDILHLIDNLLTYFSILTESKEWCPDARMHVFLLQALNDYDFMETKCW